MTRIFATGGALLGLVALVLVLFQGSADNGDQEFTSLESILSDVNQRSAAFDSTVLALRFGLDQNYDALTECEQDLKHTVLSGIREHSSDVATQDLESELLPLVEQKLGLSSQFRAQHDATRESVVGFQYYMRRALELMERRPGASAENHQLYRLLSGMSIAGAEFMAGRTAGNREAFQRSIERVDAAFPSPQGSLSFLESLPLALSHARQLIHRTVQLDRTIAEVAAVPLRAQVTRVRKNAALRYQQAASSAEAYRFGLLLSIAALIGFCVYQYSALLNHESALQDANCMLEQRVEARTRELTRINLDLEDCNERISKLALVARFTENAVIISNSNASIEWVNDAFTRITGYSFDEAVGRPLTDFLYGPDTPESSRLAMTTAIEQQRGFQFERTVHLRKDGQKYWSDLEVQPICDPEGDCRFIAIKNDIAKRVRMEDEARLLQQELLEVSRQAGMAEIANGVLHNVGNILNSVNVSAAVIRKQMRQSRLGNLHRIANLLQEQQRNLREFLVDDPRGVKVPDYIWKLTESLCAERELVEQELGELATNIDHIKNIVGIQQSMAKSSGLLQEIDVHRLVQDVLVAVKSSINRYDIRVVRKVSDDTPTFVSDRHRILQILINLVRNAKDALVEDRPAGDPATIRVCVEQLEGNIVFQVSDNGVGIPSEDLGRIFQHAYTTKPKGHGFGLHSSAIAATELGGQLKVSSAGPNQGAVFTLEVPIHPPADRLERATSSEGDRRQTEWGEAQLETRPENEGELAGV